MRVAVAAAGLLVAAVPAGAHPSFSELDNNRYLKITLLSDRVRLAYTVMFGTVPAAAERRRMDADRDGLCAPAEADAFARALATAVAPALSARLDGRRVPVAFSEIAPGVDPPRVGPFPFSVDLIAYLPLAPDGARAGPDGAARHAFSIEDRWRPERPGEHEIRVEEGPGARLLETRVGAGTRSAQTRFLFRGAAGAHEDRTVALWFTRDPAAAGGAPAPDPAPAGLLRRLAGDAPDLAATGALAAFVLGALHALGPGHGKGAVAAYLVGSNATVAHAAALGVAATFAHVASVLALGAAALWAGERFLPEAYAARMHVVAGVAVAAIGLATLLARLRGRAGHVGHAAPGATRLREVVGLGLSSGAIPCEAALAVLLTAVALGRLALGLALLLLFSLGLAATLTAVGVLAIRARGALDRHLARPALARRAALVSAATVLLLGVALATEGWWRG